MVKTVNTVNAMQTFAAAWAQVVINIAACVSVRQRAQRIDSAKMMMMGGALIALVQRTASDSSPVDPLDGQHLFLSDCSCQRDAHGNMDNAV